MSTTQRYFCGIDLHQSVIQICVLDAAGQIVEEQRFRSETLESGLAIVAHLEQWKSHGRFAVEAIGLNRWFVNACIARGMNIVVVNPSRLNLKMLGRKTDRRDAYEIARRLLLGDIDRNALTYYPSDAEHGVRKVLRTRHELLKSRLRFTNQVRRLLAAYRLPMPRFSLWRPKNLKLLRSSVLPNEDLGLCLAGLLDSIAAIQGAIRELEKRIDQVGLEPRVAAVVENLPSMGAQSAATLVYELGDVSRFKNTKAVACYAGLVPRVDNSADRSHHGPISRRGSPELRWILGEWAVRLMTKNGKVRAWAQPKLRRMHKNKLRTALARKLLVGVYIMLRRGEAFSLDRCLAA